MWVIAHYRRNFSTKRSSKSSHDMRLYLTKYWAFRLRPHPLAQLYKVSDMTSVASSGLWVLTFFHCIHICATENKHAGLMLEMMGIFVEEHIWAATLGAHACLCVYTIRLLKRVVVIMTQLGTAWTKSEKPMAMSYPWGFVMYIFGGPLPSPALSKRLPIYMQLACVRALCG